MSLENTSSDNLTGINNDCLICFCSTEAYNRVDKINMNDVKIVAPEKTGKNHFSLANEIS